jgi:hypothetical protein
MVCQEYGKTGWLMVYAVFLALGIGLGGCNNGNSAQAAQGRLVETFSIAPNSFVLLTEGEPNITVSNDTTEYTLTSEGSVSFTPVNGTDRSINLDPNEIVIERPASGMLTVIRFQ